MSASILEQIRLNHETSEALEYEISNILNQSISGQRPKIMQLHQIAANVNQVCEINKQLKDQYDDKEKILADEIANMKGSNMFSSFYESLNSIREYYQKYPDVETNQVYSMAPLPEISFSGEEVFGKYLDLHELYNEFLNIPNIVKGDLDYLQYLDKFNSFFYIPEKDKMTRQYKQYISHLWSYLDNFFRRIQPLVDFEGLYAEWKSDFEKKWITGLVSGWKVKPNSDSSTARPLQLGLFNSTTELEALGMDRLKEALEAMGLKCGGTLKDRAERLWSVRGKRAEDIPAKLKAKKEGSSSSTSAMEFSDDRRKQLAWEEYEVLCMSDIMMDIVTATRRHAEKQQTRTMEEKAAELLEEEFGILPEVADVDDDDDDQPIYNPLNIPLGWDGKPIPYWLYKLHGLGVEYKCEICGNYSYWGRRNFDHHFQEYRHAYGMRCLGIPNTKHFHDITLIEDAIALYEKLRGTINTDQFNALTEEEFEDSHGNVLDRRTYEDLARQGLL